MHKLMRKRRALAPKPPDPRDLKRLGKALAAPRYKVGLTQNELVLLTGFKSEYISLLERGGRMSHLPAASDITARVYNQYDYDVEAMQGVQKWVAHIGKLTSGLLVVKEVAG